MSFERYLDVLKSAIEHDGEVLRWASIEFRNDVVLASVAASNYGCVIRWLGEGARHSIPVILAAVNQNGEALNWVPPLLKRREDVIMTAVRQCGLSLRFVDRDLDDGLLYKIMTAAVLQNGMALKHARNFRGVDAHIILRAVAQNGMALKWAPASFRRHVKLRCIACSRLRPDESVSDLIRSLVPRDDGDAVNSFKQNLISILDYKIGVANLVMVTRGGIIGEAHMIMKNIVDWADAYKKIAPPLIIMILRKFQVPTRKQSQHDAATATAATDDAANATAATDDAADATATVAVADTAAVATVAKRPRWC